MQIELIEGDITELAADAIVNAANEQLVLGSGVAGAIRDKGGPTIQAACNDLAPIATGSAVVTDAGALPQRAIIHAVAPQIGMGDWESLLQRCMIAILDCAAGHDLRHVGVPALGTGVFGLPLDQAAQIMLQTCNAERHRVCPQQVTFCLFGEQAFGVFSAALQQLAGGPGQLPDPNAPPRE